MHATTRKQIERRLEANPQLGYQAIWAELDREFGRDASTQARRVWESVRLSLESGELTIAAWRKFQTDFELARDRVEDRTQQEEYRQIWSQLPEHWQKEVKKEESRRARDHFFVRISNLPRASVHDVRELTEDIVNVRATEVTEEGGSFLVGCNTEGDQARVLDLHGGEVEG